MFKYFNGSDGSIVTNNAYFPNNSGQSEGKI